MKRKVRNTAPGFYPPGFIRRHVRTYKSLTDLNKLDDEETEAAYLHGFCHYIQDITTTYDFFNMEDSGS